MCQEAGIAVTAVPGAAACITALTISGLATRRFAFEAFLPTDKKERQAILEELKERPGPWFSMKRPIGWPGRLRFSMRL